MGSGKGEGRAGFHREALLAYLPRPRPWVGALAPPRLWAAEAAGHSRMAVLAVCSGLSPSTSPAKGSGEPFSSQLERLRPQRAPPRGTELPCWPARTSSGLPSPPALQLPPGSTKVACPGATMRPQRRGQRTHCQFHMPATLVAPKEARDHSTQRSRQAPHPLSLLSATPRRPPAGPCSGDNPAHPLQPLVLMQVGPPLRRPASPRPGSPSQKDHPGGPTGVRHE